MLAAVVLGLLLAPALAAPPDDDVDAAPEPSTARVFDPVGPTRPPPWVWVRTMLAASGWPSGLVLDTRVQYRAPLNRSSSILFRGTFVGAGGRIAVTPAFVDAGPRLSWEPIGFFDVDVQLGAVGYWSSSSGLLPYGGVDESTREVDRSARQREEVEPGTRAGAGWGLYASVRPTLKGELGPVSFWSSWAFTWFHVPRPDDVDPDRFPLVYEPYWDRLIRWDGDLIFDHEAAIAVRVLDGVERPLLRLGPLFRHRWALLSGDATMSVGGMLACRPGSRPGWPTIVVQAAAYVADPDRVGGVPYLAAAVVWAPNLPAESSSAGSRQPR